MRRQTLILGFLIAVALIGCAGIDLLPIGRPDLTGPPSFCKVDNQGRLIVTVKNQGNANARASTTTVEFFPGGLFSLPTPAIPAGGTVDLAPLNIPAGCYNPDCEFKITVDSNNQIKESNEGNNIANGSCLG
jgi:hypothetical protein